MRFIWSLFVVIFMTVPAIAADDNIVRVKAEGEVGNVADRLTAAAINAGASVFAQIDHAVAADAVGLKLAPSELVVFGNPKLGTPIMQDNPLAGLVLPLRVLVYEDKDGQVWMAYQKPQAMFADITLPEGAAYLDKMSKILEKLTGAAQK